MKTCFGYIRVSTQKQGEGVSLEAQRDAITAFASRNDLQITEWFEEKETAAKSGRPVFTRMLKLLDRGKATGLIIHKIDRSARNLKDWAIISELSDVSAHGTVWRDCVVEGSWLIFTPVGVEDDEETRDDEGACRAGCEGHPACDAQATFV